MRVNFSKIQLQLTIIIPPSQWVNLLIIHLSLYRGNKAENPERTHPATARTCKATQKSPLWQFQYNDSSFLQTPLKVLYEQSYFLKQLLPQDFRPSKRFLKFLRHSSDCTSEFLDVGEQTNSTPDQESVSGFICNKNCWTVLSMVEVK